MATPNPNELNETIRQIQERINQLFGEEKRYYEESLRSLQSQNAELEKFKILFRDIVNASNELNRELIDTATYFRRSVNELSKQNTELSNAKNSLKSISKIASEIVYENSQNNLIEEKTLKELEKKAKLQFESLKMATQSGQIQGIELITLKETLQEQEKFFNTLRKIREQQEKIKKDSGIRIFTGLEGISTAIPGLNRFTSAFKDASKAAQEQALYNEKMFGNVKGMSIEEQKMNQITNQKLKDFKDLRAQGVGINDALRQTGLTAKQVKIGELPEKSITAFRAGINSLGPALTKALGPLILIKEFYDALIKSDKATGDIAKGLNMSYSESLKMKQELTAAANSSGDIFVTSKGMAETLLAINKTLGTNVMLNKEDLVTFTKLRETAGLTNEELMGIQAISSATNTALKDNVGQIMAQARVSSVRNGLALNEKEILKDINKVSAATTLTLGKNPKALADAVVQAKSLGLELSQVEKIAEGLLNFEQSIGAELEAELLTGRQLNLEQARYYALTGDVANLAKELSTQLGSAEEFGRLNVIQQEALAKSFGMNREELAKSLFVQEQLKNVSGEEAKIRERRLNQLIAEKGLVEAQRILADEGIEGLENQASMQDRFNASVEKLREIFVTVVEAMMPMLNIFAEVFKIVGFILKPIGALIDGANQISGVLGTVLGLLTAAGIAALVLNSSLTFGIGAAIALAAIGGAMTMLENNKQNATKTGDLNAPAKGKTIVSTKEGGLFELSPNDDVVAAPGISKKLSQLAQKENLSLEPTQPPTSKEIIQPILPDENISPSNNLTNNPPSIIPTSPTIKTALPPPSPSIDISLLLDKMDKLEQTNALLSQLVKKDTSIYMDGAKVGKGIALVESRLG